MGCLSAVHIIVPALGEWFHAHRINDRPLKRPSSTSTCSNRGNDQRRRHPPAVPRHPRDAGRQMRPVRPEGALQGGDARGDLRPGHRSTGDRVGVGRGLPEEGAARRVFRSLGGVGLGACVSAGPIAGSWRRGPACHIPNGGDRGVGTDVRADPVPDHAVTCTPYAG